MFLHTHTYTTYQIYNNKKMTRNCPHIYLVREISCVFCPLLPNERQEGKRHKKMSTQHALLQAFVT